LQSYLGTVWKPSILVYVFVYHFTCVQDDWLVAVWYRMDSISWIFMTRTRFTNDKAWKQKVVIEKVDMSDVSTRCCTIVIEYIIYRNKYKFSIIALLFTSHWKLTCSRRNIAETLQSWFYGTITHYFVLLWFTVFTVFRLLTDFVCLYNYECWLSLCKIARSSVILLLHLFRTWYKLYSIMYWIW
jgi:hypothetical protein